MFQNEYELTVDLKKKMTSVTPTFVQYDNAKLVFKIFDNGKPYDLTGFTKAEVSHKRSDGKTIVGVASIVTETSGKSSIVYTYLGSEMSKEGFNETSLSIFSADKKVSIQSFRVRIVTDLRDGLIESSKEESGILQDLIAQVSSLVESASQSVINAEKAVVSAEQAVVSANQAVQVAHTAAVDANLAKDGALLAAQVATTATDATILATADAISATAGTILATEKANNSATNADSKALLAETASNKADAKIILVEQAIIDSNLATLGANTAKDGANLAKDETILATQRAETATLNANDKATLAEQSALNANASATNADQKANLAVAATTNANLATDALNLVLPNIEGWANKGDYSSASAYKKHNAVSYNGSTYQALKDTTGNLPTDGLYWILMAQRGVDGTGSVVSVNNIPPDMNGNVDIGAISSTWTDITGKPSEFPPSAHIHAISSVTGLQTALDNAGTKAVATPTANGLMSKEDKGKLNGIETGANKYTLPATLPSSMITGLPVFGTSATKNTGTSAGNVPLIGSNGKLDSAILPAESVQSVNGKTGTVVVSKTDIGLANVDNTKQATKVEFDAHITEESPHQYGGKFEWRYNPITNSLDLVVLP